MDVEEFKKLAEQAGVSVVAGWLDGPASAIERLAELVVEATETESEQDSITH